MCNLASIALNKCCHDGFFNFNALQHLTRILVRNLNEVIDNSFYPVAEARTSNVRHRPIGIGVQGFADTLIKLRIPFESPKALEVKSFEGLKCFCVPV